MHHFLRNYRMSAKIRHFSIKLHVLGRNWQAQLPSFTFMALYSRRRCPTTSTGTAVGRAFTHIDIPYTLFRSLPILGISKIDNICYRIKSIFCPCLSIKIDNFHSARPTPENSKKLGKQNFRSPFLRKWLPIFLAWGRKREGLSNWKYSKFKQTK